MTAAGLWVVAGIVLCGFELLLPGVFLLWIGVAAVLAGGAAQLLGLDLAGQVAAFLASLLGCLALATRRRRAHPHADRDVNAPHRGLVGEHCRALSFEGSEGRVSFRDGTWPARTASGETPQPGASLRIVELDGTTLVVAPRDAGTARGSTPAR